MAVERSRFLEHLDNTLRGDARIVAAWVGGVQEAPQNAPTGGAFQLVLYRSATAPIEVDWSWRPASTAAILERAVMLFDRSDGLPRAPSWEALSAADVAHQISLGTTFFWAMAFIAAKKIARGQPSAAFGLLRMLHQARDTQDAVAAVRQFVRLVAEDPLLQARV